MIRILLFLGLCAIIEESYGDEKAIKYLMQYGYLETPKVGAPPNSFSDDEYESALKMAQKFAGIPATGKLDNQTREMLRAPRCGVPDTGSRLKRYGYHSAWASKRISFNYINFSPKLSQFEIEDTFNKAFNTWARPTGIQFIRAPLYKADIKIGFFSGAHTNDGIPFDGPGGALAHAFYPAPGGGGDIHIDDDENWSKNEHGMGEDPISLLSTAIHELGHALGLEHSVDPHSIMRPVYTTQSQLGEDDILGIQALYGA